MFVVYLLFSLAGLIGTWYFNLSFFAAETGDGYLQAWFANDAASSAAIDLLIVAVVASIFMVVEGGRLGMRSVWLLVPLGFLVAIAWAFPLFLALRHRRLHRSDEITVGVLQGVAA